MTPQVGDIWEFHNQNLDLATGPVVVIELGRKWAGEPANAEVYMCLCMVDGSMSEFIFSEVNMRYWRKLV